LDAVEGFRPGVETMRLTVVGFEPDVAPVVFKQSFDPIAAHDVRVAGLNFVILELVTVELADAIPGGQPEETAFVLNHVHDGVLGQPVLGGIVRDLTDRLRDGDRGQQEDKAGKQLFGLHGNRKGWVPCKDSFFPMPMNRPF
jgi:hypothetical protein